MAGFCAAGHTRPRGPFRHRAGHRLLRLRSHGPLVAARQSDAVDVARQPATGRAPADRADGWRHGADRRPLREVERAPAAVQGADPRERPSPARSIGAVPGLWHRAKRRALARQREVAGGAAVDRFPARCREALHGQCHDAERVGKGAHGEWAVVHGIQLHAAPGLRLLAPLSRAPVHAPSRRQRSMGEHHRRRGADPARRERRGARTRRAPGHPCFRAKIRKDRIGRRLSRSRNDVAVQVLPVLDQRGRP